MKIAIATLALIALATLDYLIIAAAFLSHPAFGEVLLAIMAVSAISAVALRQGWLLYTAQSVVTAVFVIKLFEPYSSVVSAEFITAVAEIGLGYVLAWLIARAIPPRTPRSP